MASKSMDEATVKKLTELESERLKLMERIALLEKQIFEIRVDYFNV